MKVVAIIGPFTAATTAAMMANVQRARTMADEVWHLGAVAYCPQHATCHLYGLLPEALFYAGHLEMARRCDAGLLVTGWRHSEGSLREKAELERLGKPVFEHLEDLAAWLSPKVDETQIVLTYDQGA